MTDQRTTLQTVAGLHGIIMAWETEVGVIQPTYDYAVRLDEAAARGGVATLRTTIVCDRNCDALVEVSAFREVAITLNGHIISDGSPRIEPFGNSFAVRLVKGENRLELGVTVAEVNPRFLARVIAPDRSPIAAVTEVRPHWRAIPEPLRDSLPEEARVSLWHQWNDLCNQPPRMRLAEEDAQAWQRWRGEFGDKLRELIGPVQPLTGGDVQVLSSEKMDGYRRDRILIPTERGMDVPAWLLVPDRPNGAGMVTIHGHGYVFGETVGIIGDEQSEQTLRRYNFAYAARYAERGYTVVNPDLRNFGVRRDDERRRRDACDLAALRLQQFGINLIAGQVRDLIACLDHLLTLGHVEPARIGATGLSYGGRLTMYLAALEPRIAAACASGSLNVFRERLTIDSSCAAQFVPGLLTWGDTPEVFGLIAPRPLLLELGTVDGTSPEVFAMEAYVQIQRIYAAAGAADQLAIDVFETGHRYNGAVAFDWFDRLLLAN
ncbi:MAG: alpha/beta fold hydrolase [candidate division WS1 bacterium]|nr:alpha/beta fold hydrolase [candidate division WS1 bacterium]